MKKIFLFLVLLFGFISISYGYTLDSDASKHYDFTFPSNSYITGVLMSQGEFMYDAIYPDGNEVYLYIGYCSSNGCSSDRFDLNTSVDDWNSKRSGNFLSTFPNKFSVSYGGGKIGFIQTLVKDNDGGKRTQGRGYYAGDMGIGHYSYETPSISAYVMYYSHYLYLHSFDYHNDGGEYSYWRVFDLNDGLKQVSTSVSDDGDNEDGCIELKNDSDAGKVCYSAYKDYFVPISYGGFMSPHGQYLSQLKYGYRISYNPYLGSGSIYVYTNGDKYIGGNQQFVNYGDLDYFEFSNWYHTRLYDLGNKKAVEFTGYLFSGNLYTGLSDLIISTKYDNNLISLYFDGNYFHISYISGTGYYNDFYVPSDGDIESISALSSSNTSSSSNSLNVDGTINPSYATTTDCPVTGDDNLPPVFAGMLNWKIGGWSIFGFTLPEIQPFGSFNCFLDVIGWGLDKGNVDNYGLSFTGKNVIAPDLWGKLNTEHNGIGLGDIVILFVLFSWFFLSLKDK